MTQGVEVFGNAHVPVIFDCVQVRVEPFHECLLGLANVLLATHSTTQAVDQVGTFAGHIPYTHVATASSFGGDLTCSIKC